MVIQSIRQGDSMAWVLRILGKWIGKRLIKFIKYKIDLKKIDKYVNKPNDLDRKFKKMSKELKQLKELAHPVADFICTDCGTKAKRVKRKLNKLKEKF